MTGIDSFTIELPHLTDAVPDFEQWQQFPDDESPAAARRAAAAWQGQIRVLRHLLRTIGDDVDNLGQLLTDEDWDDDLDLDRQLRTTLGHWLRDIPQGLTEARMLLFALGGIRIGLQERLKEAQSQRNGWLTAANSGEAPRIDPATT